MDSPRIGKILDDCNQNIDYLHSPDLRVKALLIFLQVKHSEIRSPDFLPITKSALVTRLDEMYRKELLNELDFSIDLLKRYQVNKSLEDIKPSDILHPNGLAIDILEKQTTIRNILDKIIHQKFERN